MNAPSLGRIAHVGGHIFLRDFKLRYRRASLGLLWAILPLGIAGGMVAHLGARLGMTGSAAVPYVLQVFVGLVVVQVFVDALDAPQQMARRYATLLVRVPFPHESLLVAGLGFVGFNLVVRLLFLAALAVYHGVSPAPTLPLALATVSILALAGLALGALIAPVSLLLWDVRFALPYVTGVLYAATPVFYPLATEGLLGVVHHANPLTYLVLTTRELAFSTGTAGPWTVALALGVATLPLAWLSVVHYRRAMLHTCPHI